MTQTLTHEITHQVMMRWLPVVPVWFSEGIAEVVSYQNYQDRFVVTSKNKILRTVQEKITNRWKIGDMREIEKLMTMNLEQWNAELGNRESDAGLNYRSAALLFTYFAMQDSADGSHLVEYLKAISAGTPHKEAEKAHLLRGRTYKALQDEIGSHWKKEQHLELNFMAN